MLTFYLQNASCLLVCIHLQNASIIEKRIIPSNIHTMKGFTVTRYGKDEKLQLSEIAEPIIGENDVLVQIYAA